MIVPSRSCRRWLAINRIGWLFGELPGGSLFFSHRRSRHAGLQELGRAPLFSFKHSQNLFLLTYQFLRLHVVVLCPAYLDVLQLRLLFTAAEDTIYAHIKLMLKWSLWCIVIWGYCMCLVTPWKSTVKKPTHMNLNLTQTLCLTVNNDCFPPHVLLGSCHNSHSLHPSDKTTWH